MDIQLVSGKTFYEFPSDVGAALIELGFARPIAKVDLKPATATRPIVPTFGITRNQFGKLCIKLTRPDGSTAFFDGHPSDAPHAFQAYVWNADEQQRTRQGPIPERATLAEYERVFMAEAAGNGVTLNTRNQ